MKVTAEQIKNLWTTGSGSIDRGDDYSPIILADFDGLDIDTDDNGWPTDDMWEILAEQFNSEIPGEVGYSLQDDVLAAIRHEADKITEAAITIAEAEEVRDDYIRAAINARVPVTGIAAAAGLTRGRIYQIRDNRR